MSKYTHIFRVLIPKVPPSINVVYSGSDKKRILRYDENNMTAGEYINYWRELSKNEVKKAMKEQNITPYQEGVFRVDIGISPRFHKYRYDIDNFLKMPLDALITGGFFKDDVNIVELFAKRLPLNVGCLMSVYRIEGQAVYFDVDESIEAYNKENNNKLKEMARKIRKEERKKIIDQIKRGELRIEDESDCFG